MNEQPKDRWTALIYGAVAAVVLLAIAFGAPLNDAQKASILGAVAPIVALVQAVVTRFTTTDNAVVVAKVAPGSRDAVAADASVYPNGSELQTVPAKVSPDAQVRLLDGTMKPRQVKF